MNKLLTLQRNFHDKTKKVNKDELLKRIEEAKKLKEQGKEKESNLVKEEILAVLDKWIYEMESEFEVRQNSDSKMVLDRSIFPDHGQLFVDGDKVCLYVIDKKEKEQYWTVTYEYSMSKEAYEDKNFLEAYRKASWKEFLSANALVCSIYEKNTNTYVGYCSIKDISKRYWELAIELLPKECHKGYGTESLLVFLKEVHKLSGIDTFRARVEVDNHISQHLMRKIGASPAGISEYLLHGDEIQEFQKAYRGIITDDIRSIAKEFGVEAEDIIGYVLEYRIKIGMEL